MFVFWSIDLISFFSFLKSSLPHIEKAQNLITNNKDITLSNDNAIIMIWFIKEYKQNNIP